ncbi:DUF4046 domain-containing protein [Bacillus pseudomycoides]|uniref:DUF4046 domain-containing protein n=1 Tax=Bacillus pseudomycoides TaxID=64104 RepID=UPI002B46BCD6|nr:DUF4046 domain-containing protein [Bacillus pseudomycoides]MEB3057545.1 DUF4046 domain-containing protein [Bacillus pseudomycoides]
MQAVAIEDIYQEILDGKRSRFPANTWKEDEDNEMARRVTKYLIETILKWDEEEIRQNWNTPLLVKYRLRGLLKHRYNNSPYRAIDDLYPDHFKEWEFGMTPLNFWTKEKALTILKWTIEEKENLSKEKLLKLYGKKWLEQNKLSAPLTMYWNGSPYAMINDLYPKQFKEWEFSMTPNKFWTKEKALEALKWTIEEKEKLTTKQLLEFYNIQWLTANRLVSACQLIWKNSPYRMINDLYPGRFKEWEFKVTPAGYWSKEKALEALRWTIEEKEQITEKQLLSVYSQRWLIKQKLWTPLKRYWNGSPYAMLNDLYPNRFTKSMLKGYFKN